MSRELAISSNLIVDTDLLLKTFYSLDLLTFGVPHVIIPKLSFSLTLIMFFAIQMGYKTAVFLGCDMNEPIHFLEYI